MIAAASTRESERALWARIVAELDAYLGGSGVEQCDAVEENVLPGLFDTPNGVAGPAAGSPACAVSQ